MLDPGLQQLALFFFALDDALGCEVYAKAECMQRTGAFKLRGAMNKILTLTENERARGFVAASSGNHGRAVAYAAQIPNYAEAMQKYSLPEPRAPKKSMDDSMAQD